MFQRLNARLYHSSLELIQRHLIQLKKMRRDKTVARILLIFTVANVALAAPAVVRQRHLDVAEGVTTTSETRRNSDDEALGDWPPLSPSVTYHDGSPPRQLLWWYLGGMPRLWWLDGQDLESNHDSAPPSTAGSLSHSGSVESIPELVSDSEPEGPANSPEPVLDSSHDHSVPETANPPTLDDSAPQSAGPSTHHDSALGSGAPSLHNNPAPEAADPSTHDDSAPSAYAHGVPAPESGAPSTHDVPTSMAAAPSTHDVSTPVAAAPSTHGDPTPQSGDPSSHQDSAPESPATAPKADGFFNDELKRKIKVYSVLGVVSAGAIFGLKKMRDIVSSGAYVSPLFPPSPADIKPSHEFSDL